MPCITVRKPNKPFVGFFGRTGVYRGEYGLSVKQYWVSFYFFEVRFNYWFSKIPSSDILVTMCKVEYEKENKNNDLDYKSFSRGFMSAQLRAMRSFTS